MRTRAVLLAVVAIGALSAVLVWRRNAGAPSGRGTGLEASPENSLDTVLDESGSMERTYPSDLYGDICRDMGSPPACQDLLGQPLPEGQLTDWLTGSEQPLCGGDCLLALSAPTPEVLAATRAEWGIPAPVPLPYPGVLTTLAQCLEEYALTGAFPKGFDASQCADIDCSALQHAVDLARADADAARDALRRAQAHEDAVTAALASAQERRHAALQQSQQLLDALLTLAMQLKNTVGVGQPAKFAVGPSGYPGLTGSPVFVSEPVTLDPRFLAAQSALNARYDDVTNADVDIARAEERLGAARAATGEALIAVAPLEAKAQRLAAALEDCVHSKLTRWHCRVRMQVADWCKVIAAGQTPTKAAKAALLPQESLCEPNTQRPAAGAQTTQKIKTQTIHGAVRLALSKYEYTHVWNTDLIDQVLGTLAFVLDAKSAASDIGDVQGVGEAAQSWLHKGIEQQGGVGEFLLAGADLAVDDPVDAMISFYGETVKGAQKALHSLVAKAMSNELQTAVWVWVLGRWKGTVTTTVTYQAMEICNDQRKWVRKEVQRSLTTSVVCEWLDPRDFRAKFTSAKLEGGQPGKVLYRAIDTLLHQGYQDQGPNTQAFDTSGNRIDLPPGQRLLGRYTDGGSLVIGKCSRDQDTSAYAGPGLPSYLHE